MLAGSSVAVTRRNASDGNAATAPASVPNSIGLFTNTGPASPAEGRPEGSAFDALSPMTGRSCSAGSSAISASTLAPVDLRAVEVEQDQVRPGRAHAGAEDVPPVQMVHQSGPVGHVGQRVAESRGL